MITSYRHDEWKKKKQRKILGAVLLVSLSLLLVRGPIANILGGGLAVIGRPFWYIQDKAVNSYNAIVTSLTSKSTLADENKLLKNTLNQVALDAYSRDQLRDENEKLKVMLGRESEYVFILSRILSTPPISAHDTLLVDAGSEQGIFVGMKAFSQGDFTVGEVTRVWGRTSLVSLYSSPNNQLSVRVGTSSIPAVAWGLGGGNLRIILPRGVSVWEGDLVRIPTIGQSYAGVVESVVKPEGSSLEAIYIRLPFDMYHEEWVYLAKPKSDLPKN